MKFDICNLIVMINMMDVNVKCFGVELRNYELNDNERLVEYLDML